MDVTESLQDYQYSSDDMDSPHKGVQKCGSGHIDVTVEGWSGPVRDNNLYVKYFDPSLDEDGLADLIKECGEVVSTKVLRDRTGASKQAGFVQMATKEGAQAAVSQLSGREVGGRKALHVAPALSRTERQQQWLEKRHSRILLHQSTGRKEARKWWKEGLSDDSRGSSLEGAGKGCPGESGVAYDMRGMEKASGVLQDRHDLPYSGLPHPAYCSWPPPSHVIGESAPYAEIPWGSWPGSPCAPGQVLRGPSMVPTHPPGGVPLHCPVCAVPIPLAEGPTLPNGVTNVLVPRGPMTNHVPSSGCMMLVAGGPFPYPPCGSPHFAPAPCGSPMFAAQSPKGPWARANSFS